MPRANSRDDRRRWDYRQRKALVDCNSPDEQKKKKKKKDAYSRDVHGLGLIVGTGDVVLLDPGEIRPLLRVRTGTSYRNQRCFICQGSRRIYLQLEPPLGTLEVTYSLGFGDAVVHDLHVHPLATYDALTPAHRASAFHSALVLP